MRVLMTGRVALVPVLCAGVLALALPAFAGTVAQPAAPARATAREAEVHAGAPSAVTTTHRATAAVLGPAVAYVREPDGTVRRVR